MLDIFSRDTLELSTEEENSQTIETEVFAFYSDVASHLLKNVSPESLELFIRELRQTVRYLETRQRKQNFSLSERLLLYLKKLEESVEKRKLEEIQFLKKSFLNEA